MYLKRKIDGCLEDWKADPDRLPLILNGAPGVGKTTAVRRFSESHYASVITVNLREPRFHRISRRKPGA
ncbi:MAG: hypothetical protein EGQ76_03220 [Sutterella sp.]|uniref:hypothetical protein n=1 Tax=Duodenibacillus massiliensis TaxID=1852381 RepID=UPI000EEC7103|nr:hypothetical protein [Duodenibacillus massiliensis]MBE5701463.1 hypothetical protein [Sutterella sp.]MBS5792550.1 hypothetical protein [Sutterella sp.]HAF64917.1 hypothetical protein [Sutterella sp.]